MRPPSPRENIINFEHVPRRRGKRAEWASRAVLATTSVSLVIYCLIDGRKEKPKYSSLLSSAFGLMSIVIGTVVERLCLVFEEYRHLEERYQGSRIEMLKACFSGIKWKAMFFLIAFTTVIIIVLLLTTDAPLFETRYLLILFCGIGVGPLVMELLNFVTQSEVHYTTTLENEDEMTCITYGLAWSYYYNHLANVLPQLSKTFPYGRIPLSDDKAEQFLDENKLFLLISHDCRTEDDLHQLDNTIVNVPICTPDNAYNFAVYRLGFENTDRECLGFFAIEFAREPLQTLYNHFHSTYPEHFRDERKRDYHVKLFYKTLLGILKEPKNQECSEKCVLVPVKVEDKSKLQPGWLSRLIREKSKLGQNECTFGLGNAFMKVLPNSFQSEVMNTSQGAECEPTSSQPNPKDTSQGLDHLPVSSLESRKDEEEEEKLPREKEPLVGKKKILKRNFDFEVDAAPVLKK